MTNKDLETANVVNDARDMPKDALDQELCDLFAAFDDVSASDELVEATLARIEKSPQPITVQKGSQADVAGRDSKSRRRARFRAIRVAAIAACLALALTGGVAYATPTSHVTVSQGETAIELGVNCFGVTVSASSQSEAGKALIGSTTLLHMSYEDALSHAFDAMNHEDPNRPVQVKVESGDAGQRERLEGESALFMAEHEQNSDSMRGQGEGAGQESGSDQPQQPQQPQDQGGRQDGEPRGESDFGGNQGQGQEQGQGGNQAQGQDQGQGQGQGQGQAPGFDSGADNGTAQHPDSGDNQASAAQPFNPR